MQKAVAYIRVSDQRQADDGSSLVTQQKLVVTHAASRGYSVVKVFREEGESAKTDQRPKLQQLIEYCQANKGKIDVLVIPKIDRLARNVHDYSNLKLKFSKFGVRIESVGERIEDNPVGRFTESILASVAQFDNEVRAERSKGGMVEAVSQGRWVWKAPLGYRNIRYEGKGTIEPDPITGPLIREAFVLLARGNMSAPRVKEWLGEAGLPMSKSAFYRLFTNQLYIGKIRAFEKVFEAKPPFVALASEEVFFKAGVALDPRKAQAPAAQLSADFPLRGFIRCECGRLLTGAWSAGKAKKYPYYRCLGCNRVNHPMSRVDSLFADALLAYQPVEGAWERLVEIMRRVAAKRDEFGEGAKERALEQVAKLKDLQKNLAVKAAMEIIPDEIAKEKIEELGREIAEVMARTPNDESDISIEDAIEHATKFFRNISTTWREACLQTKKDILSYLFPSGIVFLQTGEIRTPRNELQECIQAVFAGDMSRLVDHEAEITNTFLEWLISNPLR